MEKKKSSYNVKYMIFVYLLVLFIALSLGTYFELKSVSNSLKEVKCLTGIDNCPGGMQYRFQAETDWYIDANTHGWFPKCIKEKNITEQFIVSKIYSKSKDSYIHINKISFTYGEGIQEVSLEIPEEAYCIENPNDCEITFETTNETKTICEIEVLARGWN